MNKENDNHTVSFYFKDAGDALLFEMAVRQKHTIVFENARLEAKVSVGVLPRHFVVEKTKPIKNVPLRL